MFYAHIPHAYTCAQVYDRGGYHVPALLTHEEEGRADALPLRMAGTWRRTWSTRTGTVCVCVNIYVRTSALCGADASCHACRRYAPHA